MILPVYTGNHPILRQRASLIIDITPEIRQLAADMRQTMLNAKGIGLAAPQVGHSLAIIVIEMSEANLDNPEVIIPFTVLINPRLTWSSRRRVSMEEGCLSVPGKEGMISRPTKVRVKAQNLDGQNLEIQADGYAARLLQHEIDHLNGHLFTDYVKNDRLKEVEIMNYPHI